MVSTQISGSTNAQISKPSRGHLLFPTGSQDAAVLDQMDLDFSDVFGSAPIQPLLEVNVDLGNPMFAEGNDLIYDDPVVVYTGSHSLVGPSYVSQSLKLSVRTLREGDESMEFVDCCNEENPGKSLELSSDDEKNGDSTEEDLLGVQVVSIDDFEILKVVGQGAFGKVYQVRKKGTTDIYAMQVMRKDRIMEKNHAEYMKAERDILTKVQHPFIVQLRYSFQPFLLPVILPYRQTKYRLYLVLDFINGGHLFFQLYHHGLFREDLARVYAAEIISAVAHLHANGIMHRDLKPKNILLDADGHVVLNDFGLAKQFDGNMRSNSMCGTVEYMSPEIVLGKGHDKAADWWSVGVLIFEMLTGKPPFVGGNREKIQQKIFRDKIKLPSFLTSEAHCLLKGLLQKEAHRRLGSGSTGDEDIKSHKWFKTINWRKLEKREMKPSFCPEVDSSPSTRFCTHTQTPSYKKIISEGHVSPFLFLNLKNQNHLFSFTKTDKENTICACYINRN